jgi:hypothetical protein
MMKSGSGKPKLKGHARDGKQGAGIESGTSHKEKIGNPDLGQSATSENASGKPKGLGPKTGVSNGQVIW